MNIGTKGEINVPFRPMERSDTPLCARMVVESEVGLRYGFTAERMTKTLADALEAGSDLFVAEREGRVAGFAWVDPKGAFSTAPYLRLIAVDPAVRGGGIGALLLDEFERRTENVGRDWCLLVSDFNVSAIAFYERHGYERRGSLPDFARQGVAEILMVKTLPGKFPS